MRPVIRKKNLERMFRKVHGTSVAETPAFVNHTKTKNSPSMEGLEELFYEFRLL